MPAAGSAVAIVHVPAGVAGCEALDDQVSAFVLVADLRR